MQVDRNVVLQHCEEVRTVDRDLEDVAFGLDDTIVILRDKK